MADVDTLIRALTDKRVMDVLQTAIENAVAKAVSDIKGQLDEQRELISALSAENDDLRHRIEDLESYSRIDNIIVHGLSESFAETVAPQQSSTSTTNVNTLATTSSASSEAQFIEFCTNTLNVKVLSSDISVAHRLPKARSATGPRPLIVRFTNRKIRSQILAARKLLRQNRSKVFINEHLTKHKSDLFAETRKLQKGKLIASCWTWNGNVYVKTLESKGSKIVMINNMSSLRNV